MKDLQRRNRKNSRRVTQIIHYVPSDSKTTGSNELSSNVLNKVNEKETLNSEDHPEIQPSSFQQSLNFFRELEKKSLMGKSSNFKQIEQYEKNTNVGKIEDTHNNIMRSDSDPINLENNRLQPMNGSINNQQNFSQSYKNYMKYYLKKIFDVGKEVPNNNHVDKIEDKNANLYINENRNHLDHRTMKNKPINSLGKETDKDNTNESILRAGNLLIPDRLFDYKTIKSQFE